MGAFVALAHPTREVGDAGFSADWAVPFLGRGYPQAWLDGGDAHQQILDSRFGVELVTPVDHYRMAERSTKYALLFLALTFGLLWLFDTRLDIRVHPMQYLLVGAAMCMFYLLELSLSEHDGFATAYALAALGVVALVAAYTRPCAARRDEAPSWPARSASSTPTCSRS